MGLFDDVLGSIGGQGQSQSRQSGGAFGSTSTMLTALLGLLAAKAVTSGGLGNVFGGSGQARPSGQTSGGAGGLGGGLGGGAGGGLGGLLGNLLGGGQNTAAGGSAPLPGSGGLGGLLGGGGIAGGLGQLIEQMKQNGHGGIADSWVSGAPSQPIAPGELKQAIGADTLQELSRQAGLSQDEVAAQLAHVLPQTVDKLTPAGRLPTHDEAAQWA